jgi:hypothetical protein
MLTRISFSCSCETAAAVQNELDRVSEILSSAIAGEWECVGDYLWKAGGQTEESCKREELHPNIWSGKRVFIPYEGDLGDVEDLRDVEETVLLTQEEESWPYRGEDS